VLCVCDRRRLDANAVDDVTCIHPSTMAMSPPFRIHATPEASFALHGEIDWMSAPLLERLLTDIDDTAAGQHLVIDAEQLEFVNHSGLLALERHAARSRLGAVVVRRASASVGRLVELLDLQHVRTTGTR
jgi:anti-anti-sigma factor